MERTKTDSKWHLAKKPELPTTRIDNLITTEALNLWPTSVSSHTSPSALDKAEMCQLPSHNT